VTRAPKWAPGHVALADAWGALDARGDQRAEMERAWQLAGAVIGAERLLVEASWRRSQREWGPAAVAGRALLALHPGSLDDGLRLATIQFEGGQPREVLATVRGLPAHPRVALAEAQALDQLGDDQGAALAAARARTGAQAIGARGLVAEALLVESYSVLQGGGAAARQPARRRGLPADAAPIQPGAGAAQAGLGRLEDGRAGAGASRVRGGGRHLPGARRRAGPGPGPQRARRCAERPRTPDEAMRLYREALPIFENAANREGLASVHLNLGQQLHLQHELAEADVELQRALMATRAAGFQHLEGICLESLARLALDRGELDRSVDTARQAIALAARIDHLTTVAQVGRVLGCALQERGEVAAA
jgi:tetratricopeptide (TPR) repeat protein